MTYEGVAKLILLLTVLGLVGLTLSLVGLIVRGQI